ncbi:DUF6179 domain-containing protein [Lacrimispora sphenoides]|uniref:Uncharacterized protein n=1 Tax=Lacrimispora sphenoides JCM 1415 TaxID=1297793 RepID=A0ABY1CDL4_9FIRM|nr:DUF6179 domain-containing protein [Lacrimispora sphenoides]SET94897.1 hypothetical protein SAMN02745906_3308 [[Clostridium] sphenoides JCM 1415]SUY52636.1 Uncharacterised protein [Lacrimispora sphenoides]
MSFETEELMPIVAELADKYTGKESTSITYEKARQLMEAVLYCIHEYEEDAKKGQELLSMDGKPVAKRVYSLGYETVLRNVKETQILYNKVIPDFKYYENRCYYDTFVKGIPSFFLYYDPRFQPQNHLLTLDYPVLYPVYPLQGIDAISAFVKCVSLEQVFLGKLPDEYVLHVLRAYSPDHGDLIINLAAIVLRNILGCRMAGKRVNIKGYIPGEMERLIDYVNQNNADSLEQEMKGLVDELVQSGYDGLEELGDYLKADLHDYCFELKNAVKNQCVDSILAIN